LLTPPRSCNLHRTQPSDYPSTSRPKTPLSTYMTEFHFPPKPSRVRRLSSFFFLPNRTLRFNSSEFFVPWRCVVLSSSRLLPSDFLFPKSYSRLHFRPLFLWNTKPDLHNFFDPSLCQLEAVLCFLPNFSTDVLESPQFFEVIFPTQLVLIPRFCSFTFFSNSNVCPAFFARSKTDPANAPLFFFSPFFFFLEVRNRQALPDVHENYSLWKKISEISHFPHFCFPLFNLSFIRKELYSLFSPARSSLFC